MNYHVFKQGDNNHHEQTTTECWCNPEIDEYDGCTVVVHQLRDLSYMVKHAQEPLVEY